MQYLRSPNPNRRGRHEVHRVPDRKARMLLAQGWRPADTDQPLPDADGREKESPGTGEEIAEADALAPAPESGEIDMTDLTATHRGGGYYEIRNGSGETVAGSVSKSKAREMGAEV